MNILSPSILAADFAILGEQIKEVEESGAKYLHIDVMDGHFVPALSFGMSVIKSIRKYSNLFFDVHLMIENPERYIDEFVKAGADSITVHVEVNGVIQEILEQIKNNGVKVGLSIKPNTPVESVIPYLDQVDMILIMCVEPGFGGQGYLPQSTERIKATKKLVDHYGKEIDIEVDGGITLDNVEMILDAGANVIVAGTAVFSNDIRKNVENFMKKLKAV
ncbi:MAG: ribulose-phosphate 3-epimerase [Eubacteriales bacterium]